MNKQYYKHAEVFVMLFVIMSILVSSCASRKFVCNSVPDHALVNAQTDTAVNSFYSYFG